MNSLATLLQTILSCLRAGIAPRATRRRPRTESPVWSQIDLLAAQLEQLYAQWRADTLRDCRETPDSTPPAPARAAPAHSTIGHQPVAVCGSQFEHFSARPDSAECLEAAPQSGRPLRPLCQRPPSPYPAKHRQTGRVTRHSLWGGPNTMACYPPWQNAAVSPTS